MYGKDADYAGSRLNGTVVRYGEDPVMVQHVDENVVCHCYVLDTGKEIQVPLSDLNLVPVPLGYINSPGRNAYYAVRRPMRRDWRQGLRYNSMVITDRPVAPEEIPWIDIARTIRGKYPTFKELVESLERDELTKTTAWSRQYALTPEATVKYCGTTIGHLKNGTLIFKEDFTYLKESFEETL